MNKTDNMTTEQRRAKSLWHNHMMDIANQVRSIRSTIGMLLGSVALSESLMAENEPLGTWKLILYRSAAWNYLNAGFESKAIQAAREGINLYLANKDQTGSEWKGHKGIWLELLDVLNHASGDEWVIAIKSIKSEFIDEDDGKEIYEIPIFAIGKFSARLSENVVWVEFPGGKSLEVKLGDNAEFLHVWNARRQQRIYESGEVFDFRGKRVVIDHFVGYDHSLIALYAVREQNIPVIRPVPATALAQWDTQRDYVVITSALSRYDQDEPFSKYNEPGHIIPGTVGVVVAEERRYSQVNGETRTVPCWWVCVQLQRFGEWVEYTIKVFGDEFHYLESFDELNEKRDENGVENQ